MLFFNFLCLFYLMVLINSHTISKNIVHDETIDDIVDSIHDLEYRREYKPKHDRLHRYYRKEDKEDAAKAKEREGQKVHSTTVKFVSDATELTKLATTAKPAPKSTKYSGFWRKFRYRGNDNKSKAHKKNNELYKRKAMPRRRSYRKKQYLQYHPGDRDYKYDDSGNTFNERRVPSLQRNRHTNVDKRKRDVSNTNATVKSTRASSTSKTFKSKSSPLFKLAKVKTYEPLHSSDSLTKTLTALTLRIDDLKKEYGLKTYTLPATTESMMNNISTVSPSLVATSNQTSAEDVDFLGTAQIEALLNDIKMKAVEMVAEQSPAITDIITNTVTETTFGADPILTHISTPGYALSTFISIDNDSPFSKRTACDLANRSKTNDTVVIANTEPTHHISARSINEDIFTIAHTIEDMLQKELNKVVKKVKGKMTSPQMVDEIHKVKTTAKKQTDKMIKKITHCDKKQSDTKVTKPMSTPKTKSRDHTKKHSTVKQKRRSPKHGKNENNKAKISSEPTQSTFDDYVMLTLFEKILTKTHEDNVMKMLTTPTIASKNRNHFRLFKRTPGTLARVSLKENVQKLYDEVILPDEDEDYVTKTANPYSISTDSGEDTSYEGLSNKISYNDYVNGYRHYLKFQREQGNQNFSNLIRYQAHRHHSVDDIGKFILNKIPQLPATRLKRFFDDDIMEEQDLSTKSDESWFKKHFYFFIDNGPPRKFHTSQTVELKSPITDSITGSAGTDNPVLTPRPINKGLTENDQNFEEINSINKESIEESLEKLTKTLDERKNKEFINVPKQGNKLGNTDEMGVEINKMESPEYDIFKGLGSIGLVDKLFRGKGRRTPKHSKKADTKNAKEETLRQEKNRDKRNTIINAVNTDNLYKSQSNTLGSKVPNVIETKNKNYGYVDVNLIPRPTAIVKLRENKEKKGTFKNFFNKFHFLKRNKHKKSKQAERTKREYRVQRFNPLKKLKEIFNTKQQHHKSSQNLEMPDYEMMTSHIDTFKPIKYDKVMSVEEIKGQIPNITEDLTQFHNSESLRPTENSASIDRLLTPESYPEIDETSPTSTATTPSSSEHTSSLKPTSSKKSKTKSSSKHQTTTKPYQDSSFKFEMPEITFDSSTNKFETNFGATPSLEDIRSEIENLQIKQTMMDRKPVSITSPSSLSTARYSSNFSAKKIYIPPHIQEVQTQPKPIHVKADPKDIKIQTKLTRIAKFPMSYFTHNHNIKMDPFAGIPQIYEYANEDKSSHGKIFLGVNAEKRIRKKSLNTYVTVTQRYPVTQQFNDYNKGDSYNKPYPDYFNDLLMWHGDLLNADKLTSPQWENILKTVKQENEVSTPSMLDMQRELGQMKEYLKIDESLIVKKTTSRSKYKAKPPPKVEKEKTGNNIKKYRNVIKTVALKDDTMAKGNDILIKGEAKYFHLIKQPEPEADNYIKAADLLKDLNKIYFKSPAIKYNIEDKINDLKRNGEIRIDNIEPKIKQRNSKDQDSSSILFLDTTLLAYDDGPDFLSERPKHKKMSKNSMVSSKPLQNKDSPRPVTKTNQSPIQYFSTPLPMRMNDFERFLKDNRIDVESVTTPLMEMPKFVLNKGPAKKLVDKKLYQAKTDKHTMAKKVTDETPPAFVTINPLNVYYNTNKMVNGLQEQLTTKETLANKHKNVDDIRQKRYSDSIRNERYFFTFEPFCRKSKFGKVKKKIKLFDKKNTTPNTPTNSTLTDIRYTVVSPHNDDNSMEKEVELTIINMNDIDQNYDSKSVLSEVKLKTETPKHITSREKVETDKTIPKTETTKIIHDTATFPMVHKTHNSIPYHKQIDKNAEKITTLTTTPQTTWNFDNNWNIDNSIVTDDVYTTTFHPMISHELLSNFHAKHPPKRVRISSHSYKYDIIYNNESGRPSKNSYHSHKYRYNKNAPVANLNSDELRSPYYTSEQPYPNHPTSDRKHEIVKIIKAVEAVENYTRPNVIIHIDLPTYYMPETGPTENIIIPSTPKSMWNDFVMKYLSGLALIELLNKYGIKNFFDGKMNLTDGVGDAVNAYKVFSNAERSGVAKEMKWRPKARRSRQVNDRLSGSTKSMYGYKKLETLVPNWREKRRLKLFSNIKGKLKTLLKKESKPASTVSTKAKTPYKEENDTNAIKVPAIEQHPVKREKKDELKQEKFSTTDDGFNIDYDFDIDRIVERATANIGTTKKLKAKTKEMNPKQNAELVFSGIPYPPPTVNKENSTIKDSITTTNYKKSNKKTSPIKTTTVKNKALSSITLIRQKIQVDHKPKEDFYFDPLYDNKIYEVTSSQTTKPSSNTPRLASGVNKETLKAKEGQKLQTKSTETKLEKRDIQPAAGKFTAKDVAALEVIVDLVKNTVNYEERDAVQEYTESYYLNHPTISSAMPKSTQGTNSIQVHIAIPYNLQVEKKRSLDSYKVRRVFAAKMFSPVDLEYQVQSFEGKQSTTTTEPEDFMTPKMYLLIDANGSLAKGNFPLKPLKGNIDLSKVRVRQVATTKAFATQKAETTSGKSIGKVTLSKDFVAAVNKHLVQLYENLSSLNESKSKHHVQVRDTNNFEGKRKMVNAVNTNFRRHINWDAVKKYFGHDGVCNCKCKPNRTMCRACAASDAVISELIFEFDNLAKFMNDHCTEIQTFFWMNPSGGKKLRDTVHKVDKTLHDYFKRVKGKCQGRTCNTFSTCIDKRSFIKQKKISKKYIGNPLIVDLQRLADDIETTSHLGICYTDNLIGKGETLMKTIGNCFKNVSIREKSIKTTAVTTAKLSTPMPNVKNVYSLDNINVNIICKPESKVAISSSTAKMFSQSPYAPLVTAGLNFMPSSNFYDDIPNSEEVHNKKRKGLRQFFGNKSLAKSKMKKFFTYYVSKEAETTTPIRSYKKRQTSNQIEAPLVSDTGGTFWKDYLKGQCVNPLRRELTAKTDKALIATELMTHKSSENDASTSVESRNVVSKVNESMSEVNENIMTTTMNPEKPFLQPNVNTTDNLSVDTLSQNINELFKIFHNLTDLKEIENMSTQDFDLTERHTTTKPKHTKMKTSTKILNSLKEKLHFKHKSNVTKTIKAPKTTPKIPPKIGTTNDADNVITYDTTFSPKTSTSQVPSTTTETTSKASEAQITTTSSKPETLKFTTNHKEKSSQRSQKIIDSSQSESTKHETTSVTEPAGDVNLKGKDNLPKLNGKSTKTNFLTKLKMVTLDFFHNKAKEFLKTTTIVDTNEAIRKSRSPATTENSNVRHFHKNKEENSSIIKQDKSKNIISETTTDRNPTILIINEYGTEMGLNVGSNTLGYDNFQNLEKDSSTELNKNPRNLLFSILNYEAKKLNNELERIKKDGNQVERNSLIHFTDDGKGGFFSLYMSTENASNANESNCNGLEHPTSKGLNTKKKDTGLLLKIANKFGVSVVPDFPFYTTKEKSKATSTTQQILQLTSVKRNQTTKATQTPQATQTPKLQLITPKHQGENPNAVKSKLQPKKLKTNPKFSRIQHPIVTVNINSDKEAFKPHSGQVCDLDATFRHVQEVLQLLPRKEFEKYIINKTCDKYNHLPRYFLIDVSHRKRRKKLKKYKDESSTESVIKWDWIRNKRSLEYNANDATDTNTDDTKVNTKEAKVSGIINKNYTVHGDSKSEISEFVLSRLNNLEKLNHKKFLSHNDQQLLNSNVINDAQKQMNFVMEGSEYFEALEKDVYGIYRSRKKRSKRANEINELEIGLKNLPYSSKPNESYAMLGDSVVIQCATNNINAPDDGNEFRWITDPKEMLLYNNVIVEGPKLTIREVEARNLGDYTCQKGNTAHRKVRLTIITLPTFKVVFTPFYSINGKCTYDDLKAVQSLGTLMSREACSEDQLCSVSVDEPVCLRDRVSNTAYLRLTATMSIPPNGGVQCSGRCRRDLHNSLALMAAANALALASVTVIIRNDKLNKTLMPSVSSDSRRSIITHTLRRKDSINHRDYYSHSFSSENVNVVASCPDGYHLISDQKICAACPLGSCSDPGDKASAPTPAAQVGSLGKRFRRCYWWYPSCGWVAAGWGAACALAAAAALHARGARGGVMDVNTAETRTPRARPLSPSRVILAKFFRGSRSSTKATDSQETKFGLWKEKNLPPPLPPIDFDL